MRKAISAAIILLSSVLLHAQTKITFMPQWTPQSQFAGYYMALEKGYFKEEGLDVTISHVGINSSETVSDLLEKGKIQIAGMQLLQAMVERSKGQDIVNIMQVGQHSGLMCVSNFPVRDFSDLEGRKVGKWAAGYDEICDILTSRSGVTVNWVPFVGNGVSLFVYGAVDATMCYSYNEFIQLQHSKSSIPDANILRLSDLGYDFPDDGLYVRGRYYKAHKTEIEGFVRAARKGWEYVRAHRDEALELVKRYTDEAHIVTSTSLQRQMLDEILRLQEDDGTASYRKVSRESFTGIASMLKGAGLTVGDPDYDEMMR